MKASDTEPIWMSVKGSKIEEERKGERESGRERETGRERDRERDRESDRQTERYKKERDRERERERDREREGDDIYKAYRFLFCSINDVAVITDTDVETTLDVASSSIVESVLSRVLSNDTRT